MGTGLLSISGLLYAKMRLKRSNKYMLMLACILCGWTLTVGLADMDPFERMQWGGMGVMLAILAMEDIIEQSVPGEVVYGLLGFVTILSLVTTAHDTLTNLLVLSVVTLMMLALRFVFHAAGMGDVWLIIALYLGLGYSVATAVVIMGWILMGGMAVVLLTLRKMKRKETLPYIPFLFGAYLCLSVMTWL